MVQKRLQKRLFFSRIERSAIAIQIAMFSGIAQATLVLNKVIDAENNEENVKDMKKLIYDLIYIYNGCVTSDATEELEEFQFDWNKCSPVQITEICYKSFETTE